MGGDESKRNIKHFLGQKLRGDSVKTKKSIIINAYNAYRILYNRQKKSLINRIVYP